MTIEDEIRQLINEKCLEISANFNAQSKQLGEVIQANLRLMDFQKYRNLLDECQKITEKAKKWDRFEEDIKEVLKFRDQIREIQAILNVEY
jgi:hypothetical protein